MKIEALHGVGAGVGVGVGVGFEVTCVRGATIIVPSPRSAVNKEN